MIENFIDTTKKAGNILAEIKALPNKQRTMEILAPILRHAILCKWMIGETEEDNLYNLAVISIKKQNFRTGHFIDDVIHQQIKKYDCHQTNIVVQKKVLLLMYIERELGFHMSDEDALSIDTVEDLAIVMEKYLKGGT